MGCTGIVGWKVCMFGSSRLKECVESEVRSDTWTNGISSASDADFVCSRFGLVESKDSLDARQLSDAL